MKRVSIALVIAVFFVMTIVGTASALTITKKTKTDKKAFGAEKRYAVVTIASAKKFYGEKGMSQTFKKMEDIPGADTQPLIDELSADIIKTFEESEHFTLVPESEVLGSEAYKKATEDEREQKVVFFKAQINTANKYKYFSDPKKLAQLAKDLKVDGVITVTMSFSINTGKSFLSIGGLSVGKKEYSVMSTVATLAYDQDGKRVLRDTTVRQAEPGDKKAIILLDLTDITKTDFTKFHPSALTIGTKAIDDMHTRFSNSLEGKRASIFQKVK
ncbi:MAG: hypothetical protein IME98_00295 [Proteobacteria bacterium]|nr:hypothetical protein [Pseudomonadota bacterium]